MSVDTPNVVDAIGIEDATGVVVMTIADHLDWEPLHNHLVKLQNKINSYIAYVENDEFQDSYPQGVGRPIRIDVCCKHPPSQEAEEFLTKARQVVEEAGWSFAWRVPDTTAR